MQAPTERCGSGRACKSAKLVASQDMIWRDLHGTREKQVALEHIMWRDL